MFGGIIVGILIALLFLFIWYVCVADNIYNDVIVHTVAIVVSILLIIGGTITGITVDNYSLRQDIDGFGAMKNTYAAAISNKELTGYERATIINVVMEQNKLLARRKADIDAWWNVGISSELKNELKTLEPIE